jgi:hypothetical protein
MTSKGEFLKRFAPECQAMLGGHQVVVWADVDAWQPFLEGFLSMSQGVVQIVTAMSDPQPQGLMAMWPWFFDQGRLLASEAQVYGAGIKFDAEGAFGQDFLTVRPDGKIADYLGKLSKPRGNLLRALAGEPGMIVFGLEWMVPEGTPSFSEGVLEALLQTEQGRLMLRDEAAQTSIGAAKKLYRQLTGYSGSIEKADDRGITATGMYIAEEPEAAFESFKTASEMWMRAEWMGMMSSELTMEVAHNVEHVGELNADVYSFSFDCPNEEIKKALDAVYGGSMKLYVAPHKEGVAYAMVPGAAGSDAFARIFDSDAARLARDKRITAARNTIRPNPQACVFLDLPKIAEFGIAIWQRLGGPASLAGPPQEDVPLAAFGVYLERTAMRSEVFVPAASIKQAFDAFRHQNETPPS